MNEDDKAAFDVWWRARGAKFKRRSAHHRAELKAVAWDAWSMRRDVRRYLAMDLSYLRHEAETHLKGDWSRATKAQLAVAFAEAFP